jgi:hypothetical protein
MCIIAVVPKDLILDESIIQRMWNGNSDGAGFMYAEDGKLHVQKGYMTYKSFMDAYEPHAGKAIVMHFRIKTHGETNEINTHPFNVTDGLAFAHNGIISGFGSKEHSDTWHFNEEVIKPLQKNVKSFLNIQPIQKLISDRIGYSKLVFMDSRGVVDIVNKEKGDESSDGVWFSNTGWREPKTYSKPEYAFPYNKHSQKEISILTPVVSDKEELTMEDFVWLNESHGEFPRGSLGYVNWFSQGLSVACSLAARPNETHYIPLTKLNKACYGRMKRRIGHLQENDYVLIEIKRAMSMSIYDPEKDRSYQVSRDFVEDRTNNLDFTIAEVPWMMEVHDNMLDSLELNIQ